MLSWCSVRDESRNFAGSEMTSINVLSAAPGHAAAFELPQS